MRGRIVDCNTAIPAGEQAALNGGRIITGVASQDAIAGLKITGKLAGFTSNASRSADNGLTRGVGCLAWPPIRLGSRCE